MAKKRRCLHVICSDGQRYAHDSAINVDLIGGGLQHECAFPLLVMCSLTSQSFRVLATGTLVGAWCFEDSNRERTGVLIMPKRPYEWYVDAHGCYKFNNADLALGPRDTTAHLPVFPHLRTTNFPGPDSITRSEQARQKRLEQATKHERRQCRRRLTQPSAS